MGSKSERIGIDPSAARVKVERVQVEQLDPETKQALCAAMEQMAQAAVAVTTGQIPEGWEVEVRKPRRKPKSACPPVYQPSPTPQVVYRDRVVYKDSEMGPLLTRTEVMNPARLLAVWAFGVLIGVGVSVVFGVWFFCL